MKLIRLILVSLVLIPCLMSCQKISGPKITFETDDIQFTHEGGSQTVRLLEGYFSQMEIYQKTGVGNPDGDNGETYLKMDWIEVNKFESSGSTSLKITTDPNTSGESRSAHIIVYERDRGAYIKVFQDADNNNIAGD